MTTTPTLRVHPIDPAELALVRHQGRDLFGNVPEERVSSGGDQLRCCLTYSRPGEPMWVIAHAPLTERRPWREVGPVLVHPEPCAGYDADQGVPELLTGKPRVLRTYTADSAMHYAGNRITSGDEDLAEVLRDVLADPVVAEVHVRNLQEQCFIARVTR